MNFQPAEQEIARRQSNIEHFARSSRFRAYCCGCIYSESNVIYVCFFWSAISFYFSILAFMQKSPFYSYVQDVPLVVFGAINLLFGLVTLCSMGIFLIRASRVRWNQMNGIMSYVDNSRAVFVIAANALAVLVITLVNFILFIKDKHQFDKWCIGLSAGYVKDTYNQTHIVSNTTAEIISNVLNDRDDVYNCDRLYEDEIKWSLLCLIIMFIVYIHWILIVAARPSSRFYNRAPLPPLSTEYGNIAPSKRRKDKLDSFRSIKPSKSLLRELLVHKQYYEFGNLAFEGKEREVTYSGLDTSSTVAVEKSPTLKQSTNSNVIVFDHDIHASKEITHPNSVFLQEHQSDISIPSHNSRQSATTIVNASST